MTTLANDTLTVSLVETSFVPTDSASADASEPAAGNGSALAALWTVSTVAASQAPALQIEADPAPMMCGCPICAGIRADSGETVVTSEAPTPALAPAQAPTYAVDAVVNEYDYQWGTRGNPVTVTYSFLTGVPSYYSASADERKNFVPMNATQQAAVREILQMFSEVANITFQEVGGVGSITFGTANLGSGIAGWAYYPRPGYTGAADGNVYGDVWMTNLYASYSSPIKGTWEYNAFIHEVGHAIGLKHPGNYNAGGGGTGGPYLPTAEDTHQYTVMSYSSGPYGGREPITPQVYDIAAVQYLYGTNTSTRSGNDTYTFSTSYQVKTIWDGGGFDTFDASNQGTTVSINLRAGSFSSIAGVNNIAIAYGAGIEQAIGSIHADTLRANDDGCILIGNGGTDTLIGGAGADTLVGGNAVDTFTGGGGADRFVIATGGTGAAVGSRDRITDFVVGTDKIDLTTFDAIAGVAGTQGFDWLGVGAFNGNAGVLNYFYDSGRGVTVLRGDTNGDSAADFAIDLTGNLALTVSDVLGASVTTVVESVGVTRLVLTGSRYFLRDGTDNGPTLKYGGTDYVAGQFGAWAPIAVEKHATGYNVAWKMAGADEYTAWITDLNGAYAGNILSSENGSSFTLQQLETFFQQDLNSDSRIGPAPVTATAAETAGVTRLATAGSKYYLLDSANYGPSLKYAGADYVAGQFGGWAPIGAEKTATGYNVAWKLAGADQYTVWTTDNNGRYTGNVTDIVSGSVQQLQQLETSFGQDLNGDGTTGPAPVVATALETSGVTKLSTAASKFYLLDGANIGPTLKYGGADYVAGQFSGWAPIAAEKTASGYMVAWKVTGADQYTVWTTDNNGAYNGNVIGLESGGATSLRQLESSFSQDLNGDGTIGMPAISATAVETSGVTKLSVSGGTYYLLDGANTGPTLKYGGSDYAAGQFGGWTPIGAEKTASGYYVAWKMAGADQYTVWTTDNNGAYTGNVVGVVSGSDPGLRALESTFQQDLNGSGALGAPVAAAAVVLQGTDASDAFVFDPGFGAVAIEDFTPGEDTITFDEALFPDLASLIVGVSDDASGNAVIAAGPQDTVTLINVTSATLLQHLNDLTLA